MASRSRHAGATGAPTLRAFAENRCRGLLAKARARLALAQADPSPGPVHDLRVKARRLQYGLDCFWTALDRGTAQRYRRSTKAILKAARPLREIDVAVELALEAAGSEGAVLRSLGGRRSGAVARFWKKMRRERVLALNRPSALDAAFATVPELPPGAISSIRPAGKRKRPAWAPDGSVGSNARAVLPDMAARFLEHARRAMSAGTGAEDLHDLRLAAKRLRYSLNLFQPAYGAELGPLIATLGGLQRRLGVLSDCVATQALVMRHVAPEHGRERFAEWLRRREAAGRLAAARFWDERMTPDAGWEWVETLRRPLAEFGTGPEEADPARAHRPEG